MPRSCDSAMWAMTWVSAPALSGIILAPMSGSQG
jgi:hypothetical protein